MIEEIKGDIEQKYKAFREYLHQIRNSAFSATICEGSYLKRCGKCEAFFEGHEEKCKD